MGPDQKNPRHIPDYYFCSSSQVSYESNEVYFSGLIISASWLLYTITPHHTCLSFKIWFIGVYDNFVCSLPPRYIFRRVTRVVRSYVCRFAIPDTLSNQEILDMTGLTARQFADFTRRIVRANNARGHLVNDVSALIYLFKGLSIYHLLRREMS